MNACLFLDGTPEVGQVLTDGTVTVEVTSVDWKLDGSAVYGFSIEQTAGPRVTVTVYDGDGRSFTYHRHSDLDTFVGDDGTHHALAGAVFCYDVPNVTTTTTIPPTTTTVPPTTVPATTAPTTVPPPTTAPPKTAPPTVKTLPTTEAPPAEPPATTTTTPEVLSEVVERCEEDMPCWGCETIGNGICGPTAPATTAEVAERPTELAYTGSETPVLLGAAGSLTLLGLVLLAWSLMWWL